MRLSLLMAACLLMIMNSLAQINIICEEPYDQNVFDKFSNFYYNNISHNEYNSLGPVFLSKTSDNGANWAHYQVSDLAYDQDKCLMTIDKTLGSFSDRIYIAWQDQSELIEGITKIKLKYTTNNNPVTFSNEILIDSIQTTIRPEIAHTIVPTGDDGGFLQSALPLVDHVGNLYIVWVEFTSLDDGNTAYIKMRKSTNGGVSFSPISIIQEIVSAWKFSLTALFPSSWLSGAIDPNNGNIYIAYTQYDAGDLNIYLLHTTEELENWLGPDALTGVSGDHQFMPWLTVSELGIVSLVYGQGTSSSIDYFLAQSHNSGASFQIPHTQLNTTSSCPCNAYVTGLHAGDYIGMAQIDGDDVYPVWFAFNSGSGGDIYGSKVNPPPIVPTGFYVTGNIGEHPTLHWNANEELDLGGYNIYQKINQGSWHVLITVDKYTTSFTDPGVTITDHKLDPRVCYTISAIDLAGNESPQFWPYRCVLSNIFQKKTEYQAYLFEYSLSEAFPNPFNPTTKIEYSIGKNGFVTIRVLDVLGNVVATLVNEEKQAGKYSAVFNASNLPSGIYFYKITSRNYTETKKLILLK
jgi:hypothetical protein